MESRNNPQKLEGQRLGMFIFECVMAVLYLLLGSLFLFTSLFDGIIYGWVKYALGSLLGIYGVFRVIRAIKKISLRNE
jgi:hypothetical protein